MPILVDGASVVNRGAPLFWERAGNRAVREGKWKLVSTYPPNQWELYNLESDRGETTNLASKNTDIVNGLSAKYFDWAEKTGVVDYSKFKQNNEFIPGAAAKRQTSSAN